MSVIQTHTNQKRKKIISPLEKTLMLERLRARAEGGDRGWMVGWHYQLNGHEFEQTLGDSEEQGRLACWLPSDSPVHGILHATLLKWVAIPFSRGIFLTQGLNSGLLHSRRFFTI